MTSVVAIHYNIHGVLKVWSPLMQFVQSEIIILSSIWMVSEILFQVFNFYGKLSDNLYLFSSKKKRNAIVSEHILFYCLFDITITVIFT